MLPVKSVGVMLGALIVIVTQGPRLKEAPSKEGVAVSHVTLAIQHFRLEATICTACDHISLVKASHVAMFTFKRAKNPVLPCAWKAANGNIGEQPQ